MSFIGISKYGKTLIWFVIVVIVITNHTNHKSQNHNKEFQYNEKN